MRFHTQTKQADGLQQDGLFFHDLPESKSGKSLQGFSQINKSSEEIQVQIPPPPRFAWLWLSHCGRVTGVGIVPVLRSGSASSSSPSINRGPVDACPTVEFLLTQGYGGRRRWVGGGGEVAGLKDKTSWSWGISTTQGSRCGRKYGRKGNTQILEPV